MYAQQQIIPMMIQGQAGLNLNQGNIGGVQQQQQQQGKYCHNYVRNNCQFGQGCRYSHNLKQFSCPFNECKYGAHCKFSHGEAQQQQFGIPQSYQENQYNPQQTKTNKYCKNFVYNQCPLNENCQYSHDLKAFPCRNAECKHGQNCRFFHADGPFQNGGVDEIPQQNPGFPSQQYNNQSNVNKQSRYCNAFLKNNCQYGTSCHYSHNLKSFPCKNEKCPLGVRCKFLHTAAQDAGINQIPEQHNPLQDNFQNNYQYPPQYYNANN